MYKARKVSDLVFVCAKCADFVPLYDSVMEFRKCFYSVAYFVFHFIHGAIFRDTLAYFYHLPSLEVHRVPFGIDQLTCGGWEDHISQCTFTNTTTCRHRYAHLKCFGKN